MQILRPDIHDPAFVSAFAGFALLLKAFAVQGKIRDTEAIDEGFYGFYVAPTMNSPRRTDAPLADCFALFVDTDVDRQYACAQRLIENNELRKELTIRYLEELEQRDQPLAPWIYFSDAPKGMLGLLANQLLEITGNPVVVVNLPDSADEPIRGSARAPQWFDTIATLDPYDDLMAIGHRQACGVRIEQPLALETLAGILQESSTAAALAGEIGRPTTDLTFGPEADCDASLSDLGPISEMVRRLETLRPFGFGFEEPRFTVVVEPAQCRIRRIGADGQHLRLLTRDGLALLWWNQAEDRYEELSDEITRQSRVRAQSVGSVPVQTSWRFIVRLQLNHYAGTTRLQAVIDDLLLDADSTQP